MTKPPVTILIASAAAAVTVTVAGCAAASHHGDPAARASAMTISAQYQAAKTTVKRDFAGCQPPGVTVTAWETRLAYSRTARTALLGCMGVTTPAGQARAEHCVAAAAKTAITAAITAGSQTALVQVETKFITAAGACFK